jgi:hypothetical protein
VTDAIRRTAAEAEPGDEIQIATSTNEWRTPMEVVDVDRVEWDVPFGEDWLIATIALEGRYGGQYVALIDDVDDRRILRNDGDHDAWSTLVQFEPADDETFVCECGQEFDDPAALAGHQNHPGTDCSPSGDDQDQDDPTPELPNGLTIDDVRTAVDEHVTLSDVANALELSVGQARSVLFDLDAYSEVRETAQYGTGGIRR